MTEPISAVPPLAYFNEPRNPWRPIARFMAMVAIAQGGVNLVAAISNFKTLAYYHDFQYILPATATDNPTVIALAFNGGLTLAAVSTVIGGILAIRGARLGRRMIVCAAAMSLIIMFAYLLFFAAECWTYFQPNYSLIGSIIVGNARHVVQEMLLSLVLWFCFRRRDVRNLFDAK